MSTTKATSITAPVVTSAPELLSVLQVATILNIDPRTVLSLCSRGLLAHIAISPTLFFIRRSALDQFISQREVIE